MNGIYQMTKLNGLALLTDQPKCFYENDVETADVGDLFSRVVWLLSNRESISEGLKASVPILKKRSLTAIQYAVEWGLAPHLEELSPATDGLAAADGLDAGNEVTGATAPKKGT